MLLPVFPPCTLELPEIPESMFLVSYDGSTDLELSEQILSDPKDACSQASFGFELSAPIYFILSNVLIFNFPHLCIKKPPSAGYRLFNCMAPAPTPSHGNGSNPLLLITAFDA